MGISQNKAERIALNEGKTIKHELYQRINKHKEKYLNLFQEINPEKKQLIRQLSASELADMLDDGKTTSL